LQQGDNALQQADGMSKSRWEKNFHIPHVAPSDDRETLTAASSRSFILPPSQRRWAIGKAKTRLREGGGRAVSPLESGWCRTMADEGTTHRVFTIGIPAATQEQDGHSKPMKPKTS
jgi:hypothetical protein